MGKHSALGQAGVHPLVAEALQRRQQREGGGAPAAVPPKVAARRPAPNRPADSAVGWPTPARAGSGLGWPDDPRQPDRSSADDTRDDAADQHPDDDGSLIDALDGTEQSGPAVQAPHRAGWRRFFGGGHSSARSRSSAA